jgi:hypothetical protein
MSLDLIVYPGEPVEAIPTQLVKDIFNEDSIEWEARKYARLGYKRLMKHGRLDDWAATHADTEFSDGKFLFVEESNIFQPIICGPRYTESYRGIPTVHQLFASGLPPRAFIEEYVLEYRVDGSGGWWVRIYCPECNQNVVWVNRAPGRFSWTRLKTLWKLWRQKRRDNR